MFPGVRELSYDTAGIWAQCPELLINNISICENSKMEVDKWQFSYHVIRFLYDTFSLYMRGNSYISSGSKPVTLCPPPSCPPPGFHEVLNVEYVHSGIETVIFIPHGKSYPQLARWACYECFRPLFLVKMNGVVSKEGEFPQKYVGGKFGFSRLIWSLLGKEPPVCILRCCC